jgi:hypothetical protein
MKLWRHRTLHVTAKKLRKGDLVVIAVNPNVRQAGCNLPADNTIAEVVDYVYIYEGRYDNKKPGKYICQFSVMIQPEGEDKCINIHVSYIQPFDIERYHSTPELTGDELYVSELPETPFWEGDIVRIKRLGIESKIVRIDYYRLGEFCDDGVTPMPPYMVKSVEGWLTNERNSNLELVERGYVWKYYHNEPLEFPDLPTEADFFKCIHHASDVRNPACNLYKWTKDEVLQAIKDGTVHGFSMGYAMFSDELRISAMRFDDEELGKRVAEYTLKGFNLM